MNNNEILKININEYLKNARIAKENKEYNTAVTLFFKAMSSLCDLFILEKTGAIPRSHRDRFQILKLKYYEIYKIIDKDFSFYQDSYRSRLDKETTDLLENDFRKIASITQFKE